MKHWKLLPLYKSDEKAKKEKRGKQENLEGRTGLQGQEELEGQTGIDREIGVKGWPDPGVQAGMEGKTGTKGWPDPEGQTGIEERPDPGIQAGTEGKTGTKGQPDPGVQAEQGKQEQRVESSSGDVQYPSSSFLIARTEQMEQRQKDLLYEVLGPVFFGKQEAVDQKELVRLFRMKYGIDVEHDFCEGDAHYEEYQEAAQAIAEGMSIYGGAILFEDSVLAELAEQVWDDMERLDKSRFRKINTMLEE